jgi:hypothetical protein
MLFAFGPDDLRRLAIPIGIGIAALVILAVPALRRSVVESFKRGHAAGERHRGAGPRGDDTRDRPRGW